MTKKSDLSKLSYQQLEEEADKVLKNLSDSEIGLDESAKLYRYGKEIASEMDRRLTELENSVKDEVSKEEE